MTTPRRSSTRSRSLATSPSSSPFPATTDWISEAWRLAGYAIAVGVLLLPIAFAVRFYRSRAFRRRRRLRWAGERVAPWSLRDPMEELGPLGEEPPKPSRERS